MAKTKPVLKGTPNDEWLMSLQEDLQRKINMDKLKRNQKRLQPPSQTSARTLYQEAVREEQW